MIISNPSLRDNEFRFIVNQRSLALIDMIYFNCTTTSPAHSTYTAHSLQCKPSASLNDIITSASFDDLAIERQRLWLQALG